MWTPSEDRLQRQFFSKDDVLSCIRSEFFRTVKFYEKLLPQRKHFSWAATSLE